MLGADIVMARILSDGQVEVKDYKAVQAVGKPAEDVEIEGGVDDMEDIEGWKINGWTVVTFSRKRYTNDPVGDNIIPIDQEVYTIFAFQESTSNFDYHGNNVKGHLILYRPSRVHADGLKTFETEQVALTAALSTAGILIALILGTFQYLYRQEQSIKYSSPSINNLIILGTILGFLSITLLSMDSNTTCPDALVSIVPNDLALTQGRSATPPCTATTWLCTARLWIISLGFTLMFGSMFAKTYRVYRLFDPKAAFKKISIHTKDLYRIIAILFVTEVILLTVWTIVDPLKAIRTFTGTQTVTADYITHDVVDICSANSDAFWIISFGYKAVLMVLSLYMSNATKSIEVEDMRDFSSIGSATYAVFLVAMLVLPALNLMRDNLSAALLLSAGGIFVICSSTLLILFIPKIRAVLAHDSKYATSKVACTQEKKT